MIIATEIHQHYLDEWNGILNLPSNFSHQAAKEISIERASRI
jgi:hypothetical protein